MKSTPEICTNQPMSLRAVLFTILAVAALIFTASGPASAAAKKTGSGPIHIKSDSMEAMDRSGTVVFKGNVVAIRGDLTINADRLEVIYADRPAQEGSTEKKRVLKKIVAKGHVKIIQGKKVGTCKQATYDKRAEKLVLTGDAQVWEGSNRIRGTKITLYINEDRSVVESSQNQKVEATVYSD